MNGREAKRRSIAVMQPYALRRRMHPQRHPRSCPRHVYFDLVPYLLVQAIFALGKREVYERLVLSTLPFQRG